ncbi:MAG: glycosyltransferase family 9 protein [Alphaproteobacteria bacterium]|nr:glycosyltransferase family 9 protein [Alphaproteobacteria bacterium]
MKNILFITATRIGDAVLSTGILAHLAERYPDCRITVACGEVPAPLFAAMPNVVRVIALRKFAGVGHWVLLWLRCVLSWWYLVVDLRGTGIAWFLPTLRRRIFRGKRRTTTLHRLQEIAQVLRLDEPPLPRLQVSPETKEVAQGLVPKGDFVLGIGPTANWIGKQWLPENFVELIACLTAADGLFPGARVALFGAENERVAATPIIESVPQAQCLDLMGGVDLPTAYACLERCDFYIGNDSGLMHMAAAAGLPTLGLFGPSQDLHYAPSGPRAAVVRTRESYRELVEAPDFNHRTTGTLMGGLSVDAVITAAVDLWARCGKGGHDGAGVS